MRGCAERADPSRDLPWDVLWNRLIAITEEQAATLVRTAFAAPVSECGDLSAAVFDHRGYMLAQAVTGTPGHINPLDDALRHVRAALPPSCLAPGDVIVLNDPWQTSGHYHDVTVITPVFRGDRLVAYFGNTCHTTDIGGRVFSADARAVYEEGLCIPISHLFRAGAPNEELLRIVRANVRSPDEVVGDLYAQAAGNETGTRQLLAAMDEFGLADLTAVADEIVGRSEAAMREAIAVLPDGRWTAAMTCDGFEAPVHLKLAITVRGSNLVADYAGSSPQVERGINVVYNYTHAYTTYALKAALSPEVPNNEGSFRPVTVTAPEGCILNCQRPAAVAARHIIGHLLPSLVFRALALIAPDRVLADSYDSLWNTQWHGRDAAGRPFNLLFFNAGGMGASAVADGHSATAFPSGIFGTPVEVVEAQTPMEIKARRLRPGSGGAGKHRGGLGQELIVRPRDGAELWLSPFFDRTQHPARGLAGGRDGAPGIFTIDGVSQHPKTTVRIPPGATVCIGVPGGGGYGDPRERDPQAVAADVAAGYITAETAREVYGVTVGPMDADSS